MITKFWARFAREILLPAPLLSRRPWARLVHKWDKACSQVHQTVPIFVEVGLACETTLIHACSVQQFGSIIIQSYNHSSPPKVTRYSSLGKPGTWYLLKLHDAVFWRRGCSTTLLSACCSIQEMGVQHRTTLCCSIPEMGVQHRTTLARLQYSIIWRRGVRDAGGRGLSNLETTSTYSSLTQYLQKGTKRIIKRTKAYKYDRQLSYFAQLF